MGASASPMRASYVACRSSASAKPIAGWASVRIISASRWSARSTSIPACRFRRFPPTSSRESVKTRPTPLLALICATLLAFAGCGGGDEGDAGSDPAVAQQLELEAYDFYFEETAFTFDLGDEITVDFVNAGGATHSFTADE